MDIMNLEPLKSSPSNGLFSVFNWSYMWDF